MRPLERNDLPRLEEILRATGAFVEMEVDCALELLHLVLDDPAQKDYQVVVAEDDDVVVGYLLYGPVPLTVGSVELYWIATDPTVQGKGYGRRLMEFAEAEARRQGARLLCLETSGQDGYDRTRRFYDNLGYVMESRIKDFYKPGDDRLTYVKRLASAKEC